LEIRLKRVYEAPAASDGTRILVDRLWPRGLKKADAAIDHWEKEVAPSDELRRWFGHEPAKWEEFRKRYRAELAGKAEAVVDLRQRIGKGPATLVYAARDEAHNQAVVIKELLDARD
jgi:uncharacterized protein YeaO (DUF488 family)